MIQIVDSPKHNGTSYIPKICVWSVTWNKNVTQINRYVALKAEADAAAANNARLREDLEKVILMLGTSFNVTPEQLNLGELNAIPSVSYSSNTLSATDLVEASTFV